MRTGGPAMSAMPEDFFPSWMSGCGWERKDTARRCWPRLNTPEATNPRSSGPAGRWRCWRSFPSAPSTCSGSRSGWGRNEPPSGTRGVRDPPEAAEACGAEKTPTLLVEELPTGERAEGLLRTAVATLEPTEPFGWMVATEALRRGVLQAG